MPDDEDCGMTIRVMEWQRRNIKTQEEKWCGNGMGQLLYWWLKSFERDKKMDSKVNVVLVVLACSPTMIVLWGRISLCDIFD